MRGKYLGCYKQAVTQPEADVVRSGTWANTSSEGNLWLIELTCSLRGLSAGGLKVQLALVQACCQGLSLENIIT